MRSRSTCERTTPRRAARSIIAYCFEAGIAPEPEREDPALWEKLSARLEAHLDALAQKAPENEKAAAINQKRREIADACGAFAGHTAGVFRLVVPTGGGKTYSSMRYALHCAAQAQAGKQRIFYVAPYKTILEQNAGDIRDVLKQDDAVLEHHGDVSFEGENDEASREALQHWELLIERWDAPVILTTTVQFLNTLFDGSSKCMRRMHRLADAVIILDEVQAMPVRCLHLFNAAMNFLACVLHCAVVLCTATQPELGKVRHPILLSKPCDIVPDPEAMSAAFHRVEVRDRTAEPEMDARTLAEFVHERAQKEGSTLAVLNTKATAAGLFAALNARMAELPEEERIPLRFLSTSLCPAHRKVVVEDIRTRLKRSERLICVSTQLIEAGVNLSFACVVRALAGLPAEHTVCHPAGRIPVAGWGECRRSKWAGGAAARAAAQSGRHRHLRLHRRQPRPDGRLCRARRGAFVPDRTRALSGACDGC